MRHRLALLAALILAATATAAAAASHVTTRHVSGSTPFTVNLALPHGGTYDANGNDAFELYVRAKHVGVTGDLAATDHADSTGHAAVLKAAGGAQGHWLNGTVFEIPGGTNVYLVEPAGGGALHLCLTDWAQTPARDRVIRAIALGSSGSLS